MLVKFNIGGVIVEKEKDEVLREIETGELKLESDKLIKKSDDQIIYSTADFESFKTNLAAHEYRKGKVAGSEMIIKEGREKLGLEFDGKTIDNFADALKAKVISEANIKPNEKITELTGDNDKLRENILSIENEYNVFKTAQIDRNMRQKKDAELLSFIPENGLKVDRDIALMALKNKSGIDIAYEDNVSVVTQNGVIQKDPTTLNPVDIGKFINENIASLKLVEAKNGGAGGGNETGNGSASSYDLFLKEMETAGTNIGSMAFTEEMSRRQKEGTLKL